MHDVGSMRRRERAGDLNGVIDRPVDGHRTIVRDAAQGHSFDQLHHDEVALVRRVDIVDGDDVGVVQRGSGPCFLSEAAPAFRTLRAGVQHLDRHFAAKALIVGS